MNFYNTRGEGEHRLAYGEIRRRALELASRLMGLGLKRGDSVGLIATMHPDFICGFFACQYSGLVAVPLPIINGMGAGAGYQKQLAQVLATSHARVALGEAALLDHLKKASEGLGLLTVATVDEVAAGAPGSAALQPLTPAETSHIQFSSGSTTFPKGIEISQRAIIANAHAISRHGLKITLADRIACWLPFYHDMGLIGNVLVPVVTRISVDFLYTESFVRRPLQWLRLISDNRCTLSFGPTFGYDLAARLAANQADLGLDLSCWRAAGIGGDMIQPTVMDRFARTFAPYGFKAGAFVPSYGLAESTLAVSFGRLGEGIQVEHVNKKAIMTDTTGNWAVAPTANGDEPVVNCGFPLKDHFIEIRDDHNRIVPERRVGIVFVKGPSLMDGYFRNPEATSESLDSQGWLNTGDMGYLSGGALFITGRRKDMIIINGRNVWPQDIEWHAEQNVPAIRTRDTAAFLHHDADGKERAVILVQCRSTNPDDRKEIKREVHAAVLRNTGVDCRVELIPPKTLPFTTSGKLMRAKAKQNWLEGTHEQKMAS